MYLREKIFSKNFVTNIAYDENTHSVPLLRLQLNNSDILHPIELNQVSIDLPRSHEQNF